MTTTAARTCITAANSGNPAELATVAAKIALGTALARLAEPVIATHTLASVANTITLTPPALIVNAVRVTDVTGGTAATGSRWIWDAGADASATVCTISDDGTTLTFEGTIKAARVSYVPRPVADGAMDANIATGGTE